jgi:hypothetical protein
MAVQLSNLRSIDRALADLVEAMKQYNGAHHPRAIRLAAMIDGLLKLKGEPVDHSVVLSAPQAA